MIKAECFLEDESVLNILVTTHSREVSDLVGIAELKVVMADKKKQMRFKGFQLDICKILETKSPSTFVGFLENSIKKSLYNFPKKCPLKQVSLECISKYSIYSSTSDCRTPRTSYIA